MKKHTRKTFLFLGIFMAFLCLSAGTSFAKGKGKTISIRKAPFTTSAASAASTAKAVRKGTFTVKCPGSGYLQFTAPATKTYSFTVTNVRAGRYACGHSYVMGLSQYSASSITMLNVATKGGSNKTMYHATKNTSYGNIVSRYLKTRTGKIRLQAGQTVYLYYNFTSKVTFTLKIR
jgi:hypothetical protein